MRRERLSPRRRASTRGVPWIAVRIDVFTQVPHAFGWLTEQKPLATVLGGELELRLLNYRDTTPASRRAGRRRPLRRRRRAWCSGSTSSTPRSRPPTATRRPSRIVALTPQGRQLDQALVEELAREPELALLSSRFEGFDERIVSHLCTDAVSIGPYVLSGGELPAMVLARRDRTPAARARSQRARASTRASPPSSRVASSTRTTRARPRTAAGRCRTSSSPATTPGSSAGGASRAAPGASS